jgi:hypothetical protein
MKGIIEKKVQRRFREGSEHVQSTFRARSEHVQSRFG